LFDIDENNIKLTKNEPIVINQHYNDKLTDEKPQDDLEKKQE